MYKILLVEDSAEYVSIVHRTLGPQYQIQAAGSLAEARRLIAGANFDLILLDLSLPDGSGFDLFAELRGQSAPVIVLSGHGEVQDKVMGWSLGADDYITKPFSPIEFQARVGARIEKHRAQMSRENILRWQNLDLDLAYHEARVDENGVERKLELTPIEFKILHAMMKNAERVLTRGQLIQAAWGGSVHVTERTVDKHISVLRQKIDSQSVRIKTVSGLGYSLVKSAA